jgi:hypothetical protein
LQGEDTNCESRSKHPSALNLSHDSAILIDCGLKLRKRASTSVTKLGRPGSHYQLFLGDTVCRRPKSFIPDHHHGILQLVDDLLLFRRGKKLFNQLQLDQTHIGACLSSELDA